MQIKLEQANVEIANRYAEIERAKDEIERLSIQKTNMFINLAHETRTPLTLVKFGLEAYMKKQVKSDEDLKTVKRNIDKLINDMVNYLDVEKLARNQIFYNHEQVSDLSALLKERIELLSLAAQEKGLTFLSKVEAGLYVKADPAALERVLNNLLHNAIQYTDTGHVGVELTREEALVSLKVIDTGPGISAEEQKNIFSPYFQAACNKRNIQGIGMGLYITSLIIKELQGEIAIESHVGHGSLFTVRLPLHQVAGEKMEAAEQAGTAEPINRMGPAIKLHAEEYAAEKPVILIIEDKIELLAAMQNCLKTNYNIFYARHGKEALEKLNISPRPDLMLCDIMMDTMDGYQFADTINTMDEYQDIPLIFITAKTTEKEKLEGLGKGAVDYIYKPFSMDELLLKVENILNSRERQKEANTREFEKKVSALLRIKDEDKKGQVIRQCREFGLTRREQEIVLLELQAIPQKEMAARLNIALYTLQKHISNIHEKCQVKNREGLFTLFEK